MNRATYPRGWGSPIAVTHLVRRFSCARFKNMTHSKYLYLIHSSGIIRRLLWIVKNRNLTLLSKRFENQLPISWFYSRRCKYTNQKLRWNLSFLVHCDLWCYICLSIWCCRVIVNSRRFLTSNWIPLVPGELGFNHDVKILYTLFSNDMDSWHCSNIIHSNISSIVAITKYHSLHIIMIHDSIPSTYLVLTSAGNKIKYWLIQF